MKTIPYVLLLLGLLPFWPTPATALPDALANVMEAATVYLNFDSDDGTPEIGNLTPESGEPPEITPLPEGRALRTEGGKRLRFTAGAEPDFSRPGSAAFWVSPRGWQWGDERPYNQFFSLVWEGGEHLVITRQGLMKRPGEPIARHDRLLLSITGVPGAKQLLVKLGDSDPDNWADGSWHLFVMTWNGPDWSVSMDGEPPRHFTFAVPTDGPVRFQIGGTREPTCFKSFSIFNRELSPEQITTLHELQKPVAP